MRLKILSGRILLIAVLTGFIFSPMLVFASTNIFMRTLHAGMRGEDVRELQKFLNTDTETRIASVGAGSPGNETGYFGSATKRALIKFQEKYRAEVLVPIRLKFGTGILGAKTREKISALLKTASLEITFKGLIRSDSARIIENNITLSKEEPVSFGLPVYIKIPSIKVDAPVEHVGLTSDGAMDVPKGPNEVAWFNLGSRPGESGSAVIAGHYGWKNNIPAVFDNLHKLRKGDKISTEDEKGVITAFVVREIQTYGKDEAAPDVFGSDDGKVHLNLITCAGVWNKAEKTRSERLVVFADKE